MSAQVHAAQVRLASLPVIRWGLWREERWIKNSKISVGLWLLNFGLFYIGVKSFTHNTWVMNFTLSLGWDVVWYFINRFYLWGDRRVSTGSSTGHAFLVWLLTFSVNQSAFWLFVGQAGIDWYFAKPLLTFVSIASAIGRYKYNNGKTFAERPQTA